MIKTYENIRKIATGQGDDYATGCLLDYSYLKDHYKLIATELSKQQVLDADPRAIQQINFTANLDWPKKQHCSLLLKKQKKLFCTFHKEPWVVWNRQFWDRFLLAIFKSIKKDTHNPKNLLSISPNVSMTPFHNKKIITFIIILKSILTNLKTLLTILIIILKSISSHKNHLKKPQKFLLIPPNISMNPIHTKK